MNIKKLAPWNWFKKEQEQEGAKLPVRREESQNWPDSPLFQIHREIDRLFDDAFRGFGLSGMGFYSDLFPTAQKGWLKPTLDVGASDKEYAITVELPGIDQKDVRLELSDDTLRISGEKKQEKENSEKRLLPGGKILRGVSAPADSARGRRSGQHRCRVQRRRHDNHDSEAIRAGKGKHEANRDQAQIDLAVSFLAVDEATVLQRREGPFECHMASSFPPDPIRIFLAAKTWGRSHAKKSAHGGFRCR